MRPFSFLPLLFLAGTAFAGTTYFELQPGETRDFLVTGSGTPTITVEEGDVQIHAMTYIAGAWLISLQCISPTPCSGWIEA